MYEFPSGNFLFVKLKVVITGRKMGEADSTPSFLDMTVLPGVGTPITRRHIA